jgi:DNA-binding response OmpR family regulator
MTAFSICRLCGAPKNEIPEWSGYKLELLTNSLTGPFDGIIKISPTQAEILCVLLKAQGHPVLAEKVVMEVWGREAYDMIDPRKCMCVHIYRMRLAIAHTELRILSHKGSTDNYYQVHVEATRPKTTSVT